MPVTPNMLYYGDCLDVMRDFPDECVGLICLDPPFNSDQEYNSIFKDSGLNIEPQIKAFDDMWGWNEEAAKRTERVKSAIANPMSSVLAAFEKIVPNSKMLSYTSYMAERLFEMKRILKVTGSIYYHCDPTSSHYIKLLMDSLFGENRYQAEIAWKRTSAHNDRVFGNVSDRILFYGIAAQDCPDNRLPLDPKYVKKHYRHNDARGTWRSHDLTGQGTSTGESGEPWRGFDPATYGGRHWSVPKTGEYARYIHDVLAPGYLDLQGIHDRLDFLDLHGLILFPENGGFPNIKRYLMPGQGQLPTNMCIDIFSCSGEEYLGYKTQKPVKLYERFIKASGNEGDLVLDPFCGCGTTVEAALKNRRSVIGIDILPFAINLVNERLDKRLGMTLDVQGVPVSMETAGKLALDNPLKFQDWAISLVDGLASNPKKVGDDGIDGFGMLYRKPDNMDKRAILVQVSGANGSQKMKFDKLQSDVHSYNAAMGVFITKDKQNAFPKWAVSLPPIEIGQSLFAPMQCLSIEEYFQNGNLCEPPLNLPPLSDPWTGEPMLQKQLPF